VAALDNGVSSDAPTVLLVPGYTGSKEDFQPLLRPLAGAGLRAIAIDQRGQYQSDWARTAAGYELGPLAADVVAVAQELRLNTNVLHLLGHSFGGLVARQAILQRPELFEDLVLMDSGPAAITGGRRRVLEDGEPVLSSGGMSALWDHLQAQSQADPRYVRPAPGLLAFLRERFMATDPVSLRVMGNVLKVEPDRTDQLAVLAKPTLVLFGGDDDAWAPAVQTEMARRLSARLAIIPNAAHSPAVENPARTAAALIEFWSGS
jgi:pimeloyl-ACP methyl ester carboxylesterase